MTILCHGDLLRSEAEALVNTVNCAGVMGRGLALQFKTAFQDSWEAYARACEAGQFSPAECSSMTATASTTRASSSTFQPSATGETRAG